MPGDRLALAVTVRGQVELVDVLEQVLQLGDGALLVRADDVERLEVGVDVDAEPRPRLRLVLGGHVGGSPGQVADVPAGGLDDVVGAQVASYFARLGRRLDYDEPPHTPIAAAAAVPVCHLCLRSTSSVATGCRTYAAAIDPAPSATDNFALRAQPTQTDPPLSQPVRCVAIAENASTSPGGSPTFSTRRDSRRRPLIRSAGCDPLVPIRRRGYPHPHHRRRKRANACRGRAGPDRASSGRLRGCLPPASRPAIRGGRAATAGARS